MKTRKKSMTITKIKMAASDIIIMFLEKNVMMLTILVIGLARIQKNTEEEIVSFNLKSQMSQRIPLHRCK